MDILVHGYNVKDPKYTVGKLKPYVDTPFVFDYGWFSLISVLLYNKREAKRLKVVTSGYEGSTVYAHSNAAAIAVESARQGARIKLLICINPALKCKTFFPESIERVIVIHTKHDRPTRAARFFDKVPFIQLLVPNSWGAMGAKGARLDDDRVFNWDLSDRLAGHSDFFKDDSIEGLMIDLKKLIDQ